MVDVKGELLRVLRGGRVTMLGKLDGLSEYDVRRPMTPTGTNLLGLVKHLAGIEYGYLGESFGRPPVERPSWFRDDPYAEIDMWATPDESTEYIVRVYQQACAHSDATVTVLDLDTPGYVAHWPEGRRDTTLGVLLIRVLADTTQHAGHADIVREQLDGRIGSTDAPGSANDPFWQDQKTEVQKAADAFRT
ncbi:DinB family protein [Kribbella sp. NPDC004875]|uniref:DinB family protein n=1 Tax=Kribbella sp. NPDC004875 TaxID=3364107 RepID=UPI0036C32E25